MDGSREEHGGADDGSVAPRDTELHETRDELSATSEILRILAANSTAEDVFGSIVEHARLLGRADAAFVHLYREGAYWLTSSVGLSEAFVALSNVQPVTPERTSLIGRVALDRRTQQIVDVLADPEYDRPDFQRIEGYRTILGAPMLVGDEVVGVLSVWRHTVEAFDDRVATLLTTFARQGALAVRNVQLVRSLEDRSAELVRRVDQLEALADVSDALSSSLDADEVLSTIVSTAVELAGADGGSLLDLDGETGLFRFRLATGTSPEVLETLRATRIHRDETLVGRACRERVTLEVEDLLASGTDPHLDVLRADGWRSVAVLPLIRSDTVVGALVIRRRAPGSFADVAMVLEAFASQSAIALTNARLYRELEVSSADLADASRHKSEFLASMSHELRTPLNAIIGFSEVLLERMVGELNERQDEYLRDILGSGRHLLALLNDILDLSKVEAGQMELERSHFVVADAVAYAMTMVRERSQNHGISLRSDIGEEVGIIHADELRFKQVLLNLLSNAVKFTPDGGTVVVEARRGPDEVVVTVADTGIGVAPADQARIFESFQQGSRSLGRTEGTGLGLSLTKRIVELHGGHLWLRSELGHGSTFGFSVPSVDAGSASGVYADQGAEGDDRPVAVVIEDDPASAALISVHLEAAGLRAVSVARGPDGLRAVRALNPAIVLLDIRLPGMDGWEVLTTIKGDPRLAATPVVVISVLPERGRGIALGASDYLVKPVSRTDLLSALDRIQTDELRVGEPSAGRAVGAARVAVMVDDDPAALELVRLALTPGGWTVHTCDRAEDVFGLVRDLRPSVVLVDLLMPDMDGFEVIDRLRGDPRTAGVPIVVLTAKTLTARDRSVLEGRISFVASKRSVDLRMLAGRLVDLVGRGTEPSGVRP